MAINQSSKQSIVSALCKHFAEDPKPYLDKQVESNIKELCLDILKASGKGAPQDSNEEVMKWIAVAESCLLNADSCVGALNKLNEELITKSVLLGNGLKLSVADVIVFSVVQPSLVGTTSEERNKLPHLLRWMDYIQSKEDFGELFEKVALEKVAFDFQRVQPAKIASKVDDASTKKKEADLKANTKETVQVASSTSKPEADASAQKTEAMKNVKGEKDVKQEKKKQSEAEPASDKDKEVSVSLLNIRVGLICKAWKHPSADSLLVEEIDVGEAKPRQVVSGLAKYCTPEALTNRRVVLITNVKPGKLRDVMSEGLVLCASNEDHSVVEPLLPPEGANVGERVAFAGYDGKPEDVLNPKKKQLDKITPHLFTDEKGVATFKGVPFMTSGGPCISSIPKATIK